jgi:tetratricopeptide (TPR) repeat protein
MRFVLAIAALCAFMAIGIGQTKADDNLEKYQKLLEANPSDSLAHYRIAEVLFLEGKYQSAANEFTAALKGDRQPKWTEVWSHIQLGKIFDTVGQRERAVNQYKLAEKTKDNTKGALDDAAQYLKSPYQRK